MRRWGGAFGEEPGADLGEAAGVIVAEVEVFFVRDEVGDGAIAVEDAGEFDLAFVGLVPEGVGPFFADPVGGDGGGGEDKEDEIGVEAFGDFGDDVVAGGDFGFVEPDGDLGVLAEEGGQFADEGFVDAGVAEEDTGHVTAELLSYGSALRGRGGKGAH